MLPKSPNLVKPRIYASKLCYYRHHSFSLNRDIKIEVTGLGVLDWLVSNIITWVVGLFNAEVVGVVDKLLREYVNEVLPFVDPNKYFG
jgi:hypothetical protein